MLPLKSFGNNVYSTSYGYKHTLENNRHNSITFKILTHSLTGVRLCVVVKSFQATDKLLELEKRET